MIPIVALSILFSFAVSDGISDARTDYVGHKVYVIDHVPGCYGHVAKVISLKDTQDSGKSVINALGERVNETPSSNPSLSAALLCPGNRVASDSVMLGGLQFAFRLLPDDVTDESLASYLQEDMESLVATAVYARSDSMFYPVSSTLAELQKGDKQDRTIAPPLDDALAVKAVKVWKTPKGFMGLLKLGDSSGQEMFAVEPIDASVPLSEQYWKDLSVGKPSCGALAMRHAHPDDPGSVNVGDSSDVVKCQYGRPDHVNTEDGTEQWVYDYKDGSSSYIYVADGKVIGQQHQSP